MTASTRDLEATARAILAGGRGILAADESTGTMSKRLEAEGIESTEETRRRFRELMFTTEGIEQCIGGVILYDETIMNGTHSIERSYEVTHETLHEVFRQLHRQRVALEGMLLKTNMVVTGYDADQRASVDEVAERTLRCLCQTVPAAVPGIVFLSGGQSDFSSSAHLNAMSKVKGLPWVISFSYARALQGMTLKTWAGKEDNARDAQAAFHYRCRLTAAANAGQWSKDMEREPEEVVSEAERELEAAAT